MRMWAQWGTCAWVALSAVGCPVEDRVERPARDTARSMTLRAEVPDAAIGCPPAPAPEDAVCIASDGLVVRDTPAAPDGGVQQVHAQLLVQATEPGPGLPLQSASYDSFVVGTVAETIVKQRYVNPLDHTIEAVYVFPLPHDGAVFDYTITVQDRRLHGEMKRRAEAREIYDEARRDGRTAGLLEQERPNVFTQSIANIPRGEAVEVELRVVQPLRRLDGRYTLTLPTVVGPRYVPGASLGPTPDGAFAPDTARVPDGSRITPSPRRQGPLPCPNVSIKVALESGSQVDALRSKHHDVELHDEDGVAHVTLSAGATLANRDFELSWTEASARERATLVVQPDPDIGGGYFTLTLEPAKALPRERAVARELVFVIDASGSMRGEPIETAKATVRRVLGRLGPSDVFQIVQFSQQASSLGRDFLPNTPAARARGLAFVDAMQGEGGTEMLAGVRAALAMPRDPRRLRMVLFLTDGFIGNESEIFREVRSELGDARLFSLGVGSSVNRHLLDGLARIGRGDVAYMGSGERPEAVVDRFYERIDRPALTDVAIDWGGLVVEDVEPQQLPDLFAGTPVVVFGKYKGEPSGVITLRGRRGRVEERIAVGVDFARPRASSAALAAMWARSRIARLGDAIVEQGRFGRADALREQVIELALAHHVMTEHTAFVAVDDARRVQPGAHTVHAPVEMPSGVSAKGVFGANRITRNAFGVLGMSGTGRGGAGSSAGVIGLGTQGVIGTIGHGAGGGVSGYGRGAGGYRNRSAQVPRVRLEPLEARGALSPEVIRRVIQRHINELRFCHEQELNQWPELQGQLWVRFVIAPNGSVSAAVVTRSTLPNSKVATCVAAAFRRWTFPSFGGQERAVITAPLTFEVLP